MEQATVDDVFAWYVSTEEFRVFFSDLTTEEFRTSMINSPRSMKKLIEDYWDHYLGNNPSKR